MEPAFFPVLIVVTLLGVRVIGVRLGWWRALLIAWLGLATAGFLLQGIGDVDNGVAGQIAVAAVGLVAMVTWTGVFELFSRSRGETARRSELNPFRSLRGALSRARRKSEIAFLVTRFGLGHYGRRHSDAPHGAATGAALRDALGRAGGVYVKLGQFFSTRPDLVSEEIAAELGLLQQQVDPLPSATVTRIVAEELGDLGSTFRSFEDQPAASASIAQVHRAVLADGRAVAVKVQRPDVAERVRRDLDILVRSAEKLESRTQWASEMRLLQAAEAFSVNVTGELDFEAEARNLRLLSEAVRDHPRVVVPQPVTDLTRSRVLVMEWVDGEPVSNGAHHLDGDRRADLARALLHCLLDQILTVGVFHADPHPGNVYLDDDGRIALIDCGAIGRLDRRQRTALRTVLVAIAAQDPAQLRSALRGVTTPSRTVDEVGLERALGGVLMDHLGVGAVPGAALLTSLMDLMREFGLALDPVIGGAVRALTTVQPTLEALVPGFDLLDEAKAYGQTLANPFWSPTTVRSPREELEALLPAMLPSLAALPGRVDRIVESVERDELSVGLHLFRSDRDRRFLDRLAAQILVAVVPSAIGLIGGLLVLAAGPRIETETGRVLQAVGFGCVGVSLLVLLSTLVVALRTTRGRS